MSIEVLRPVPSVALIPLAMLMFGFGARMEVSIVAFATFWPTLILVQSAVQQVEPRLLEVSRVLGLSARERACKIVLPAIVPRLFVALRLGVAVALVVAVTVEIAANPNGMGYAMMIAQQSLDPALACEPSTFFTRTSPIGRLFDLIGPRLERGAPEIAILGLGAGTLASYARPGERWQAWRGPGRDRGLPGGSRRADRPEGRRPPR